MFKLYWFFIKEVPEEIGNTEDISLFRYEAQLMEIFDNFTLDRIEWGHRVEEGGFKDWELEDEPDHTDMGRRLVYLHHLTNVMGDQHVDLLARRRQNELEPNVRILIK